VRKFNWIVLVLALAGCATTESPDIGNVPNLPTPETVSPDMPKEELTLGAFKVVEGPFGSPGGPENVISLEEAAELAGEYLLRMLGMTLEGQVMQLSYNYNPWISHATWGGEIFEEVADMESEEWFVHSLVSFSIEAITREPHSLWISRNMSACERVEPENGDSTLSDHRQTCHFDRFDDADREEMALLETWAIHYATLHFESEVVHLEASSFAEASWSLEGSPIAFFFAMDAEGRIVDITIDRETFALVSIGVPSVLLGESTWVDEGSGIGE